MIYDSHSHTEVSSDSEMLAADALAAAEKLGLGLVFTEHFDYDYKETPHYRDKDFRFDPKAYWTRYEALRGDKLRLGVEVGLTDTCDAANREFVGQAPFDQVIGSIHILDNLDLYFKDFYEGKTKAEAYGRYFEAMARLVRASDYIDVLGHIDYISRYAAYENTELQYSLFADAIDQVLQAVVQCDVVMELNTRRLGNTIALKELVPVYKRYAQLGGRYVTLGSDGHTPDAIGMNFKVAQEMADALGLKIVTFCQRKMEYCK